MTERAATPATLPVLAVLGAASLFGMTGTIAELGPDELTPVAAGVWRSLIGAIGLVVVGSLRSQPIWAFSLGSRWIWIGGLGAAAYQLTFFEAVDRTGVALGTLVTIGVGPPVAGLLDVVVHRRSPRTRWVVGSFIAIAGVAMLSLQAAEADPAGIAFAVLAGCSFPLFGLAGQQLMEDRPLLPAMASVFAAGAILTLPLTITTGGLALGSLGSVATVTALGLLTLTVAYVLWGYGLRTLSLGLVVTVTLAEPAIAALLAVVVLDEPFTVALLAGLVLVAVGVTVSSGAGDHSPPG